MIILSEFKGKKVSVFGLGRSGNGAARALSEGGAEVYAWDDGLPARETLQKLNLKNTHVASPEEWPWQEIKILTLSPGVPLTHPQPHPVVNLAKAAGCPIICDIELLYHARPEAKYIGITGTNGKSTTTSLVHHILKSSGMETEIGGNIGISALDLQELNEGGTYVIEVSSYQLDLLAKTRFNIALLLNITPDHIDRHGTMQGYINAKKRIFHNMRSGDIAIIGVDDDNCRKIYEEMKERNGPRLIPISNQREVKGGVYVKDGFIHNDIDGKNEALEIGNLKNLIGMHNNQNIAAAFAACYMAKISWVKIIEAIRSFPGLAHRVQLVGEIKGISFVNDSKATNAEAAEKAILCFDNIYWIAGGMPKEGGIEYLKPLFGRIKKAFLIGKAQNEFADTLRGHVEFSKCGELSTAVEFAAKSALTDSAVSHKKPVILLSPACASFDQFKNFEERGEKFVELVQKLKKKMGV